jgi:hypothetical protein
MEHAADTVNLFEVTYKKDAFVIDGKEYPLGYSSYLAVQPECRFMDTTAFVELKNHSDRLSNNMNFDALIEYRNKILDVIDSLNNLSFFLIFDLEKYQGRVSFLLAEERINRYIELNDMIRNGFDLSTPEKADQADSLIKGLDDFYTMLSIGKTINGAVSDLMSYASLVFQMTNKIVENGARTKSQLAEIFGDFLSDPYLSSIFRTDQLPFRTKALVIPVVEKENGESHIFRKVYYSHLNDFLMTDLFEGYRHGHYLWQCGICDDYFFMTTAHKQLYCSKVNSQYGVPCSYVAKHPEVLQRKPEQQKKTASPYYLLWKRRSDLIRKNKSLGKYNEAVSAKAKEYIDACFELARVDFEYAATQYMNDMEMTNVYQKATEMLNV